MSVSQQFTLSMASIFAGSSFILAAITHYKDVIDHAYKSYRLTLLTAAVSASIVCILCSFSSELDSGYSEAICKILYHISLILLLLTYILLLSFTIMYNLVEEPSQANAEEQTKEWSEDEDLKQSPTPKTSQSKISLKIDR